MHTMAEAVRRETTKIRREFFVRNFDGTVPDDAVVVDSSKYWLDEIRKFFLVVRGKYAVLTDQRCIPRRDVWTKEGDRYIHEMKEEEDKGLLFWSYGL